MLNLSEAFADFKRHIRDPDWRHAVKIELGALRPALTRALPVVLKARGNADFTLLKVLLENAEKNPGGLAYEMDNERLTWWDAADQTSRIAHVLADAGVQRGDAVALLGANSPTYMMATLGISRIGGTAALINNHLEGQPLSHAIKSANARVVIVEQEFAENVRARADLEAQLDHVLVYRKGDLEDKMASASSTPFPRAKVSAGDDFVYIYTSGTTGLPKPCKVTHARAVSAGNFFGTVCFAFGPGDKLYSALPLYHSNAMLLGASGCIMTQTPMAMRSSFSASQFWNDVQRYRATAMLYIGELCRYLVNTKPVQAEKNNPIRVAVGNGMRPDVWEEFQRRFGVPLIREFYGATEAPGLILNLSGKVGSIGRVPLRRLGPMKVIRYDVDNDEHQRGSDGYCVECGANEVGELIFKLENQPLTAASEFRGYTDEAATKKKVLTDVFVRGDKYYRSGDLLRFDDNDFFYFVDRIGDTFRWKGENVSTAEVADVIGHSPRVKECTVASVPVPGNEGQAGMCAVVTHGEFDKKDFWKVVQELPAYAQPRFVRVLDKLATTGTFKIQKTQLRSDGVNPDEVPDPIYLRSDDGYVRMTTELWKDVTEGRARL